jgi:nucleotide-binding universal stress UspA family protein
MKTLLVPTDFSENARNAIDFALHLGAKIDVKIIFFYAQHIVLPSTTPIRLYNELRQNYIDQYKKELNIEIEQLLAKNNLAANALNYELLVKNTANFVEGLCEAALENQVDLVIMGTRGAGGIKKIFLGSNTVKVIEQAPCAVLAIPANWNKFNCNSMAFASELIDTEAEISKILHLFREWGSQIDIFHVFPNVPEKISISSIDPDEWEANWQKQFNYPRLKLHLVKTEIPNDPIYGIELFIKMQNPDVLITFPQKKSWTDKLFDPSITNSLAYSAQIPLLAMK